MSNNKLCKGKHLIIKDRLIIEYGLDQNYTLKEIAETMKKYSTTISNEIKKNRFLRVSNEGIYYHFQYDNISLNIFLISIWL